MKRFNPYMDFEDGSGFVAVTFYDVKLTFVKDRKINAIIQRDYLEGSCQLIGDEAAKAATAFITNSKFKLNLKVYEWGTDITGTLIWEGAAFITSKFDFNRNLVEFKEFETSDLYSPWLHYLSEELSWNEMLSPQDIGTDVLITEGVGTNTSQIQTLSWNGTDWSFFGTPYSIPLTGKPVIASENLGNFYISVYDNVTQTLTRYIESGGGATWAPSTSGTKIVISSAEYAALAARGNTSYAFLDGGNKQSRTYVPTLGGWNVIDTNNEVFSITKPSMCFLYSNVNEFLAYVDEDINALFLVTYGGTASFTKETDIGGVKNVDIVKLSSDGTVHEIALIDSEQKKLRTFKYDPVVSTIAWEEQGEGLYIGDVKEPSIVDIDSTTVGIHDCEYGALRAYSWDAVNLVWSQVGNSFSLKAGYYSSIAKFATNKFAIVIGDSIQNEVDTAHTTEGVINAILFKITGGDVTFGMDYRNSGDSFSSIEKFWGYLSEIEEAYKSSTASKSKISVIKFFEHIELMFQNFWYLEEGAALPPRAFTTQIKFTQPDQFSSFGSVVDVSAKTANLNIREYLEEILTDRELTTFANALNTDFLGKDILYGRDTGINIETLISVTTDWDRVNEDLRGNDAKFERSGLYALQTRFDANIGDFGKWIIEAGTGILGGTNIRNEKLSKSRLQNDYFKEYRFANDTNKTININGVNVPVSGTCKRIVDFPEVTKTFDNFPGAIAELDWGGGVKSFVTRARTDWISGITTFESVLLDL